MMLNATFYKKHNLVNLSVTVEAFEAPIRMLVKNILWVGHYEAAGLEI